MDDLKTFAQGTQSTGNVRWEKELVKTLMEYIESETVMKNYCQPYPVPMTTLSANIPTNEATGSAVTISEGGEIPAVRMVTGSFDITVEEYGTAAEVTDEAKATDWLGITGEMAIEEAGKRMGRKENADIMAVLLAGAGETQAASSTGHFKYEDAVAGKVALENKLCKPDIIFINPDQQTDILLDERFVDASRSGTTATLREGSIGRIAGCDVIIIPEMPSGTAIMMCSTRKPLWFASRQNITIEPYREAKLRIDGFTVIAWGKPAVVRPEAILKIINC